MNNHPPPVYTANDLVAPHPPVAEAQEQQQPSPLVVVAQEQQQPPPLVVEAQEQQQPPPPVAEAQEQQQPHPLPLDPSSPQELAGPIPDIVFLDIPIYIVCPVCNFKGRTKVDRTIGCCSSLFCCFACCCTCCKDYQHSCPQCRTVLGSFQVI